MAAFLILCGYTNIRLPVRPKRNKVRIACIGDSISYGCTLPLFFLRRYPSALQRQLGTAFQVGAFGVNDRTLQSTGNKPYRRESAFRQSKTFQPDTVVILLGTNDSKDVNWRCAEDFRQQYLQLIAEYRSLPTAPRILLCTPPHAFKPVNRLFYITNDAKCERIPEIVATIKSVAAEARLELIDLYAFTDSRRDLFGPDGLHPNSAGAKAIANEIFQALHVSAKSSSSL